MVEAAAIARGAGDRQRRAAGSCLLGVGDHAASRRRSASRRASRRRSRAAGVDVVADRADHRGPGVGDHPAAGSRSRTAAAPRRPPPRAMTMTSTSGSASSSATARADLGDRRTALDRDLPDRERHRGLTASGVLDDILLGRAPPAGDQPDLPRQERQRPLRSGSNSPSCASRCLRISIRASRSPTPTGRICRASSMSVPRLGQNTGLACEDDPRSLVEGRAHGRDRVHRDQGGRGMSTSGSRNTR